MIVHLLKKFPFYGRLLTITKCVCSSTNTKKISKSLIDIIEGGGGGEGSGGGRSFLSSDHNPPTQISITFNNGISRSEIRYNSTGDIEEERLDFKDTILTCFYMFSSYESKTKIKFSKNLFFMMWPQIVEENKWLKRVLCK